MKRQSMKALLATAVIAFALVALTSVVAGASASVKQDGDNRGNSEEKQALHHDVSPPLRDLAPASPGTGTREKPEPTAPTPVPAQSRVPDPVVQSSVPSVAAPATSANFEGIGNGLSGFTVNSAPPDSNGAAGPNHFVEIVNSAFAVFNKTGGVVYGPVQTNTIWSGFGGGCQANNDGDATVAYDRLANRWVISQFSVTTTPYLQCVAVSTTGDPTGAYYRYSFQYANFPDYPKLGVWPDAYYTTFNLFNPAGTAFLGPEVCAFDRAKMLAGQAATQQCFTQSPTYGGLLPSDMDGSTVPPTGAPNYVLSFGTNSLLLWKFHVDWATPGSSTFTGPTTIPVAAFSPACSGGGTCIPQSGTSQRLDSLADRLMYRLAYRNFGDHESLVINHSVTAGSSVGVRWYELRSPSTTPTVYQQGTYAPDSSYRWMGSAAMDRNGDIGLGFSVSSSSRHPGIHYTGRLVGDPLGQMTQGEGTVIDGAGSQTGSGLSRWGDYTSISIDPSDDCTFWYTNEYIATNGAFNWHTRVGSFKFPSCVPTGASDFSISATPASLSLAQGGSGTSTINTAITSGSAQTVSLSASGQPAGTTVSFSPASVTSGGSSTMTVAVGASTLAGSYTITVTGTGTTTHSTTVSLTVTAATVSDFSISATPGSLSIAQGGSGTSAIGTVITSGSAQAVSLSASGQPAGTTVSFSPASVTSGGSSTMTVAVGASTVPGSYTITVTGTGTGTTTHSTTVSLTVTAATVSDFSISATPGSLSIAQGGSGTSAIGTTITSGAAQTVSLSASGQPAGTTVSFSPASVTSGGSSTMTVTVGASTTPGSYTITVTGTGTTTHTTTVSLTVTAPPGGVVNGGFETGSLSGWSASGAAVPAINTPGRTGSYSARLGSASAFSGSSTLTQNVAVPTGSSTLTFWYQPHCTDTITYDQIQMQIRNTAGTTLATVLNVCSNSGAWTQVSFNTTPYAGTTVVLWFNVNDDGYPTDPTYTLLDDVALNPSVPVTNVVLNPSFETGSLSSWSASGTVAPAINTPGRTGSYSARLGSTSAFSGSSTLTQNVSVPSGSSTLTFWYQPHCTDTITYDQIQMQIRNTAGTTLATVLNVCSNSGAWTQVTFNTTAYAGTTVVLWFNVHDDGYPTDPTYTLLDDVALN